MDAIHINEHTQKWIAKTFNEGLVPELEGGSYHERSYYLVKEDDVNEIVSAEDFERRCWEVDRVITRPPRKR